MSRRGEAERTGIAAHVESFRLFLTLLVDTAGQPLEQPTHLLRWAALLKTEPRLVLRAPRGHGKTTLLLAYALWHCWRHNRTATGWVTTGEVRGFDAVLVSATHPQALELMARFRDLLLANDRLFGDLLSPDARRSGGRTRWSATEVRLPNGAQLRVRAYRTSVRGLHPDLLLLDDVLNDENSLTSLQRDKTLSFFMGTLMPMHARRIVVIGTALHQDDLLARLSRTVRNGPDVQHTALGFRAASFRALNESTGATLWPERFSASELLAFRDEDPLSFSREYQNEPRDDAASMFPFEVTQPAIDAGAECVLGPVPYDPEVFVVMGVDLARSAGARADFTVVMVVEWNLGTGIRRVLDIRREKGLEYDAQVALVTELAVRHRVFLGQIEDNGFQAWLLDALRKQPETAGKVFGHRTGANKADGREGIPRLALSFRTDRWVIPSGDRASLRLARIFQAELAAFGYRDGKLGSVGEHDDTVIAAWLVERAIALLEEWQRHLPREEWVTMEDLGIERVKIGEDW